MGGSASVTMQWKDLAAAFGGPGAGVHVQTCKWVGVAAACMCMSCGSQQEHKHS